MAYSQTREALAAATKLDGIIEVEEVMEAHADCAEIELVRTAYEKLAAHFAALREVARRQLSGAISLSDPAAIMAVLDESSARDTFPPLSFILHEASPLPLDIDFVCKFQQPVSCFGSVLLLHCCRVGV